MLLAWPAWPLPRDACRIVGQGRGKVEFERMPTVHAFTLPNEENGTPIMSTTKRTAADIAAMGGTVVPNTAEEIDEAALIEGGVYLRPDSKQNV